MAVAVCLIVLGPATAAACYYLFFTVVGLPAAGRPAAPTPPRHRLAVLIPAHNEEAGLPRTIRSLRRASYPPDLLRVVVIADNCTDRTARVAAALSADVIVRTDPGRRGKGFALARGVPEALAGRPDAVLILDADCDVTPGLLRGFDRLLSEGAQAAQARLASVGADNGPAAYVAAVGAEIDHGVAVGRQRLGGTVPLRGTGMLFRREVLERLPWSATGLAEDGEYAAALAELGVPVRLLADESVLCDAPPTAAALFAQRRRWRAALRVGRGGLLFRWPASKPLTAAHLALAFAAVPACVPFMSATAGGLFAAWLAAVGGVFGWVYARAIARVGLTRGRFRSLCRSPALVIRLAWLALGGRWRKAAEWKRTDRPTDPAG